MGRACAPCVGRISWNCHRLFWLVWDGPRSASAADSSSVGLRPVRRTSGCWRLRRGRAQSRVPGAMHLRASQGARPALAVVHSLTSQVSRLAKLAVPTRRMDGGQLSTEMRVVTHRLGNHDDPENHDEDYVPVGACSCHPALGEFHEFPTGGPCHFANVKVHHSGSRSLSVRRRSRRCKGRWRWCRMRKTDSEPVGSAGRVRTRMSTRNLRRASPGSCERRVAPAEDTVDLPRR